MKEYIATKDVLKTTEVQVAKEIVGLNSIEGTYKVEAFFVPEERVS